METIRKYETVTELNRSMLVELIDSIYVYQAEGTGKDRKQRVEINYRFLCGVSMWYRRREHLDGGDVTPFVEQWLPSMDQSESAGYVRDALSWPHWTNSSNVRHLERILLDAVCTNLWTTNRRQMWSPKPSEQINTTGDHYYRRSRTNGGTTE